MEWQADCFAGHLLMPEIMVRRYWHARTKSENPLTQEQIARRFNAKTREKCSTDVLVWLYIRRIADQMGVSAQALSIRLKRMGLIADSEPLAKTGT